jgi:phosphotransferase system  glucose/maltose/N-acetylglucosamine-specific IIC component
MSFNDILPIILVIIFWAILFVFAFWMATVALRAPTEGEIEAQHAEAEHAQAPATH